jgi:preprotein translocase subunit Sec61beta
MNKALILKIMLGIFFVAGLIAPQYAEELKAMEQDPAFVTTITFVVTAVLAWADKFPFGKKDK